MLCVKPLLQRSVICLGSPSYLLRTLSAAQWRIASTQPFCTASETGENVTASASPSNIEVETQGFVKIVAINRPEKRNAVNRETAKELYDVFQDFEVDEGVRVGVLCGRGGTFCAGYDLSEIATTDTPDEILSPFGKGPAPMGPTRTLLSKPVIAAVSGHAVAGGLELALMCDMRVVEEDAVFGVFCRRFGVPLLDGGTVRLPALIGLSRAMDMILTGRAVGAEEARLMGLANRVVSKGKSLEEALKLANQIAEFPQRCLRADRRSAYCTMYRSQGFLRSLGYEHRHGEQVLDEARAGARKFTEGVGRGGIFHTKS